MLCSRSWTRSLAFYNQVYNQRQTVRSASKLSAIKRGLVREERRPRQWVAREEYPPRPADRHRQAVNAHDPFNPRKEQDARPARFSRGEHSAKRFESTTYGSNGRSAWTTGSALREKEPSQKETYEMMQPERSKDADSRRTLRLREPQASHRNVGVKDFLTPGGSLSLTTAASSWIYGASAALACLRSGRRTVYRAYLSSQLYEQSIGQSIRKLLGRDPGITVHRMDTTAHMRAMDSITGRRPHQGILLEVSPLPFPPAQAMARPDQPAPLTFHLGDQRSEEVEINKKGLHLKAPDLLGWRAPLVLLLDGIKDEGNMGNIIRTAYFYGIEAIAICVNTCAPISSPIVAKAASGAIEAMPLLRIDRPSDFIRRSQSQGWKVWASVPPTPSTAKVGPMNTADMRSPLADGPTILMLGSEGDGLRDIMLDRADGRVTIASPGSNDRELLGVDSLNVASAAAVLLEAFMRKPSGVVEKSAVNRAGLTVQEEPDLLW